MYNPPRQPLNGRAPNNDVFTNRMPNAAPSNNLPGKGLKHSMDPHPRQPNKAPGNMWSQANPSNNTAPRTGVAQSSPPQGRNPTTAHSNRGVKSKMNPGQVANMQYSAQTRTPPNPYGLEFDGHGNAMHAGGQYATSLPARSATMPDYVSEHQMISFHLARAEAYFALLLSVSWRRNGRVQTARTARRPSSSFSWQIRVRCFTF